jgi:NAD-dependent DNA ligase
VTIAASDLSLDDARAEADDLVSRIETARDAYYGSDTSEVDDRTYDGWLHRLEELEDAHPVLRAQDSPRIRSARPRRRGSTRSSTPSACSVSTTCSRPRNCGTGA